MKCRKISWRILAILLALGMLCSTACGSLDTATTMWLMKTEGTVSIWDEAGKNISLFENMKLYSGYGLETEAASFAWLNLDSTKLAKMDVSSEIEIQQKNKDLKIVVNAGKLYFNITKPLEEDETLNIKSSTMAVSIHGTCGWVEVSDSRHMKVYILEGTVQCTVAAPESGEDKVDSVSGGEMAELVVYSEDQLCDIIKGRFEEEDIADFVLEEIREDTGLCEEILDDSGLDVLNIPKGEISALPPGGTGESDNSTSEEDTEEVGVIGTGDMENSDTEISGTPTPEGTDEPTPEVSDTLTPEPTDEPTSEIADTPTPEAADTPTPEAADTPTPEAADTPTPEAADTPTPEAADTPTPEAADAPELSSTPTPTAAPASEAPNPPTPKATSTPTPEAEDTPTPKVTNTPTPEPTNTPTPRPSNTPTPIPTPTLEPSEFSGGDGSESNPYIVSSLAELEAVLRYNGKYFEQSQDLDFDSRSFASLFTTDVPFTGTYNGNGYSIKNIVNSGSSNYSGIFKAIGTTGSVSNLTITDCTFSGGQYVGIIAGKNDGKITDCTVKNCFVTSSGNCAGGICGVNSGRIISCELSDNSIVSRGNSSGGVCGENNGIISDCTSTGDGISASGSAGGIAGDNTATIMKCTVTDSAISGLGRIGGIVGSSSGSVSNCEVNDTQGLITGNSNVGGIIGNNRGTNTKNTYYGELNQEGD